MNSETAGEYVITLFSPGHLGAPYVRPRNTLAEALWMACTYWKAGWRCENIKLNGKVIFEEREIENACARIRVLNPDSHNVIKTVEYVILQMGKQQ